LSPSLRLLKNVILYILSSASVTIDTVHPSLPVTCTLPLGMYVYNGASLNRTNFPLPHAFGHPKQRHFKHNGYVWKRKRCCTSVFVMIILEHVRWPSNKTHYTEVSCTNFTYLLSSRYTHRRPPLAASGCTHNVVLGDVPHTRSFTKHTRKRPTQQWYDGVGLRFIQTSPFPHSIYYKTLIGSMLRQWLQM